MPKNLNDAERSALYLMNLLDGGLEGELPNRIANYLAAIHGMTHEQMNKVSSWPAILELLRADYFKRPVCGVPLDDDKGVFDQYGPVPFWDDQNRELYLGKTKIKDYDHQPAKVQIKILRWFQEHRWARTVALPPKTSRQSLRNAIDALNRTIEPKTIVFWTVSGESLKWGYVSD